MNLITRWHTALDMPKYDEAWHQQDLADIYQTINYYNRDRIHSAHKMSPVQFAATKRL